MRGTNDRNSKVGQRGHGSRDLLLEFWDPLHILRTVEARNFKFVTPIQSAKYPSS